MNRDDFRAEVAKDILVALFSNQTTINNARDKNLSLAQLAVSLADSPVIELELSKSIKP